METKGSTNMTTDKTTAERIREQLDRCIEEAIEQGYEFTGADLDSVTDALGFMPTREEWAEAGLDWVGETHCADDSDPTKDPARHCFREDSPTSECRDCGHTAEEHSGCDCDEYGLTAADYLSTSDPAD